MSAEEFRTYILPFYDTMYRVAFLILHSEEDAADVVQEAMMAIWQKRGELSPGGNLKAYCVTAARNRALTLIRDSREQVSLEMAPQLQADSHDILETQECVSAVEAAMRALPENQRRVVRLSSFAACSNEEIARITGLSGVNVRALLSRGRKKLRELLMDAGNRRPMEISHK